MERKSQCPHCRMPLKLSQIINIRFINELSTMIENMNISKKQIKQETCSEHNVQLLYFCVNCNESLCSDCYMFGKKHKDHEINKIDNIYNDHIVLIKTESKELQSKYEQLNSLLKALNERIIFVRNYKLERTNELEELFDNLRTKLEGVMHVKLSKLLQSKNDISDKLKYLECVKLNIDKELIEAPKSVLIAKSDELIQNMRNLNIDCEANQDNLNVSLDIPSDIYPPYESSIFEIKEYKKIVLSNKEIIYSPELMTNGLIWRLKVYPNGNGATAKGEYISIFLELIEGLYETSKYYYKIELMNYDKGSNKANYNREFSSDFQNGECWGYNRFYRIENLDKEGFIDQNGTVCLKFYVRPQTYSQLCRDQKNYICSLEKKMMHCAKTGNVNDQNMRTSEEITMNNFNLLNKMNNAEHNKVEESTNNINPNIISTEKESNKELNIDNNNNEPNTDIPNNVINENNITNNQNEIDCININPSSNNNIEKDPQDVEQDVIITEIHFNKDKDNKIYITNNNNIVEEEKTRKI